MNFPADSSEKKDTVRLQAFLAHCGVASRRASEKIIAEGRVTVNGTVVTELGTKVSSSDKVCVDGKSVSLEEKKRYVLLNKPAGYVCSLSDEKGRPVASDLLSSSFSERLYNVGRLDMFSSGLIIFTNDGDFAARLSHPSSELEKEYIVDSTMQIPATLPQEFKKGIRIEGVFYRCLDAQLLNARRMSVVLAEGKNREIRRVFDSKKIGIKTLRRIRIGNILIENLKEGEFRQLTDKEVENLLRLCKKNQTVAE